MVNLPAQHDSSCSNHFSRLMHSMPSESRPYAVVAEFVAPAHALRAAESMRHSGFTHWEVYSPYPVSGMSKAMGLGKSPVGWFSFVGGLAGFTLATTGIWYMNKLDYPLPVGGKPLFSPFSAFPTVFELTILCAALLTVAGMLFLNRLPRFHHSLLKHARFARATNDRFFLVIETADPKYSETEARELLKSLGAVRIELVEE